MQKQTECTALMALLNCGTADIDFMLSEFNNYQVKVSEAVEYFQEYLCYFSMNFNDLLSSLYQFAFDRELDKYIIRRSCYLH